MCLTPKKQKQLWIEKIPILNEFLEVIGFINKEVTIPDKVKVTYLTSPNENDVNIEKDIEYIKKDENNNLCYLIKEGTQYLKLGEESIILSANATYPAYWGTLDDQTLIVLNTYDLDTANYSAIDTHDTNSYTVPKNSADNDTFVFVNFTLPSIEYININATMWLNTSGGGDFMGMAIWSFINNTWQPVTSIPVNTVTSVINYTIPLIPSFIKNNQIRVMAYESSVSSRVLKVDYIGLIIDAVVRTYDSIDINVTQDLNHAHLNISQINPYNNIVLYYPFDVNYTLPLNKTYDYTEYGNDGAVFGNAIWNSSGKIGGDYDFNGLTGYVDIPDSSSLNISGDKITLSLWFKSNIVHRGNLIGRTYANINKTDVTLFIYDSNGIYFDVGNGTAAGRASSTYTVNTWTHAVGVYNGSNIYLYLNGNLANSGSFLGGNIMQSSLDTWTIGKKININAAFFNGSIDEVMIFNSSLNSSQVSAIYNNQSSRFVNTGTQLFNNTNVSVVGNENRLNISFNSQRLIGTNISVSINGTWFNLTNGGINDLQFTDNPNSLNITLIYISSSYNFYTPLIFGNLTFNSWYGVSEGADTVYPTFSNLWDNNATINGSGIGLFNVTILKTNGTAWLIINNTNYTAQNLTTQNYNVTALLYNGTYAYYWAALGNGTSHNYNQSDTRYYTLNNTVADTVYPTFSNYWDNNATINGSGIAAFNVSVLNTNTTVWLTINNTNYTAQNLTANNYNVTVLLFNGTYSYFWSGFGNGTSHWYNQSYTRYYVVNNTLLDTEYPTFSNFQTSPLNNSNYNSSLIYNFSTAILKTNGTAGIEFNGTNYSMANITTLFNKTFSNLGAGKYNYYFWAYGNGTSRWYNSTNIFSYVINKSLSQTGLTFDKASPQEYGILITPTCTNITGKGTPTLTNGTSGVSETLGVGAWTFNCSLPDNQNYTASSNTTIFTINQNSTLLLGLSATTPITYGTITDFIGSGCPAQLFCSINISNAVYPAGNISANYSTNGNANYTASSITKEVQINKENGLVKAYINNTENNYESQSGNNTWLNGTLTTGTGNIELWLNGSIINSGASPISNLTNLSLGYYNLTAVYSGNQNYTADIEYWWINITGYLPDTTPPTFDNLANQTIEANTSLSYDIDATDISGIGCFTINDTTNFKIDCNGIVTNNTYLNMVQIYYLNVSVNDTLGNIAWGEFYVNVTAISTTPPSSGGVTASTCRYKKLGYYNTKLPWLRQENCI